MKKRTAIGIIIVVLCSMMIASCQLLLSSEERKLVGKWHEKIQETEDFVTIYIEGWDEYTEDKDMSSYGKITLQYNIGDEGYNFIVYATVNFKSTGTWEIADGDKLISKNNEIEFSNVQISSATELDADGVQDFKKRIKQDVLSDLRDEMLEKDTTEVVLITDKEFKYKDDDGKVYTMTRVN